MHEGKVSLHPTVAARVVEHLTAGGGAALAPSVEEVVVENPLSERERDVLRCLAQGLANKEAAARLGIAESTVKTHLANLFTKLGVSDRTEAVTVAVRRGWLSLR